MPCPAITSSLSNGWMNVSPSSRGDTVGAFARASARSDAVQHDARAELAAVRHLDERGEARHHDGHRNAEQAPVIRDALGVVARGHRDHALLLQVRRELQQCVARATLLEAAGSLQVVELAPDVRAGQLRQRDRLHARRLVDATRDARARSQHVVEREHRGVLRQPARTAGSRPASPPGSPAGTGAGCARAQTWCRPRSAAR